MDKLQNLTEEDIEEAIEEPLGDDDIKKYLPDALIMKYSNLEKYNSIDELLPGNVNYCVILYEESPNKGHWVCVLKYADKIEFFDSYGGKPDAPLNWNPSIINEHLNQKPFLSKLFDECPYEVIYNPIEYQSNKGDDINTCGRHCVFRIINLIQNKRDLKKYYNLMNKLKKKTGASYDEIASFFINED